LLAEWAAKDPVTRFEQHLAALGLWSEERGKQIYAEAVAEVSAAAREAEEAPPPGLETIFSDVFEQLPAHLRRQGQTTFDLAARKGDAAAGDGAFPL
jgi:2-oxoisovalerate dehydrogenase E1 component alpha subunit